MRVSDDVPGDEGDGEGDDEEDEVEATGTVALVTICRLMWRGK